MAYGQHVVDLLDAMVDRKIRRGRDLIVFSVGGVVLVSGVSEFTPSPFLPWRSSIDCCTCTENQFLHSSHTSHTFSFTFSQKVDIILVENGSHR